MSVTARAAELSGYTVAEIKGRNRARPLCIVRWAVMLALHRRGMPASSIGRILNRNHSTIFSGLRQAHLQEVQDLAEKLG